MSGNGLGPPLGVVRRPAAGLGRIAELLERPALHVDETGFRVDGRTRSLHVVTDGTCKFLHRKRGRQAIEEIGISYTGTLDCRAA